MNLHKIGIIIKREFLTRIKKKSFIVMSILGPFLFAAMIILPMFFATMEDNDVKVIAVIDSSHIFIDKIPDDKNLKFKFLENKNINQFSKTFRDEGYWGVLYISHIVTYSPNSVLLYSYSQPSMSNRIYIENALKKEMEKQILRANNLEGLEQRLESAKNYLNLKTIKIEKDGKQKESNSLIAMIIGYGSGILIYFFILLFGTQVMRGVIEEKSNRIVEVIVSSVKPFELMMGKILGIAGVALMQFAIWVVLTFALIQMGQEAFGPQINKKGISSVAAEDIMNSPKSGEVHVNSFSANQASVADDEGAEMFRKAIDDVKSFPVGLILLTFVFYFVFGYLLYAALFAAVGSAVDNEADTQQFILPVTLPLILSIYVMINTINNPEGALSFWFSIIPLTSPVVMMVRVAFGVPWWELAISMISLFAGFLATTWLAAKIYRTGILMYGKKVNYKEIVKWIKYK